MSDLELEIRGSVQKISGPGSRAINKIMQEQALPVIMDIITDDVHAKAMDYASGIESPAQKVPRQATHPIGQSDSGYSPTGELSESIKIIHKDPTKKGIYRSVIAALLEYASWVEFGTGIFGPRGEPIVPKGRGKNAVMVFEANGKTVFAKMILGQPPQPFMRGAMWYIIDNFSQTRSKIQSKFRSMK